MTDAELKRTVLDALGAVAPEADPATLRGDASLRDQLDLDSFDFLRFVIGLHERLGVEIPEADYHELATVDQCVAYLKERACPTPPTKTCPPP